MSGVADRPVETDEQPSHPPLITRRFTSAGIDPFETVEWSVREARAGDFYQPEVEAPTSWSDSAVGIVAKLYFQTINGVRETSVRQLIRRVANKITREGLIHEYFVRTPLDVSGIVTYESQEADTFYSELVYILLHQMAAFNTPVWLNFGVPGRKQVASACYLLSVEDQMVGEDGITGWWEKEAKIFKSGAGSGINLSNLRGSMERLSTGGIASGPVSYMRPADAAAGTLKCLARGTEVMTPEGPRAIEALNAGDLVLTRYGSGTISKSHANGIKDLVRVKTRFGDEIVCTPEHRFLVRDRDGEEVWREVRDFRFDDHVVFDLDKSEYGHTVDLLEPSAQSTLGRREFDIGVPEVMDEQFAQWLGWIYGDGNVTKRPGASYVGVQIPDRDEDLVQKYLDLAANVFTGSHRFFNRRHDKPDASCSVRLASTKVVRFLRENGFDKSDLRIPSQVKRSPQTVRAAFLSGLFEADGGVVTMQPTLSTVSRTLALDVMHELAGLGIPSKIREDRSRIGSFGKSPVYIVRVVSRFGAKEFADRIGFISKRRQDLLNETLRSDARYEIDWSIPSATMELNDIWESADYDLRRDLAPYCRYARPRSLSRLRADALLTRHESLSGTVVEEIASGALFFSTVTVEPAGQGEVFDITVDGSHEYLLYGNMVTHNSGGAHRRAAKLVCLNDDHPDVFDFIDCKSREDDRMRILMDNGVDLNLFTPDGERNIAETTSFQNQNISVRLSDDFMRAVENDDEWALFARTTSEITDQFPARRMMRAIAEAAWKCGDPGVMFHSTINKWHTTPSLGPITTSNPCVETNLNDDSSCNLASLNLLRFMSDDAKTFFVDDFRHVIDLMILAMDITCSFSESPTERINENTRNMRQLGLGIANLGTALMSQGLPYDSDDARSWTSSVMALLTGRAYRRSADLAKRFGTFEYYSDNVKPMARVIQQHKDAVDGARLATPIWEAANVDWKYINKSGGFRNSQVTLVAPTGTISFMMDCDTTGCEPAYSLVTYKRLAGAGEIKLVNRSVRRALENLGYAETSVDRILARLATSGSLTTDGMSNIRNQDFPVFATAAGENAISPMGHLRMIAAIQPFISGAVSKTCNLPHETTVEEIEQLYVDAWDMGIKAMAVFRDGSKATSILSHKPKVEESPEFDPEEATFDSGTIFSEFAREDIIAGLEDRIPRMSGIPKMVTPVIPTMEPFVTPSPTRRRMPNERESLTHKFQVDGHEGYITAGKYPDGTLGEIFVTMGKEGSNLSGFMDAWAASISVGLQYGVPLETYVSKFSFMSFEPSGPTANPEIMNARSIVDYIARWLAAKFLSVDVQEDIGVMTPEVRERKAAQLDEAPSIENIREAVADMQVRSRRGEFGPPCANCSSSMHRTGACWTCPTCGNNTGCG